MVFYLFNNFKPLRLYGAINFASFLVSEVELGDSNEIFLHRSRIFFAMLDGSNTADVDAFLDAALTFKDVCAVTDKNALLSTQKILIISSKKFFFNTAFNPCTS